MMMSSNISQLKDRYVRQEETDYVRDWMLQIASLSEPDFRSTNHSITDGNSSNNRKTQLRERERRLLAACGDAGGCIGIRALEEKNKKPICIIPTGLSV